MNNTGKKVGYLKGLLDSVKADDSASDKLLRSIVDVLSDLSDRADVMDDLLADLNDYVESIDDDLTALEGAQRDNNSSFDIFDGEDDEDFDDDFDSAGDQLHILHPEIPAEPQPEPLAGALCPECMRLFFVSLDDPADAMYVCPHCGKKIHPVALSPENAPVVEPAD